MKITPDDEKPGASSAPPDPKKRPGPPRSARKTDPRALPPGTTYTADSRAPMPAPPLKGTEPGAELPL